MEAEGRSHNSSGAQGSGGWGSTTASSAGGLPNPAGGDGPVVSAVDAFAVGNTTPILRSPPGSGGDSRCGARPDLAV